MPRPKKPEKKPHNLAQMPPASTGNVAVADAPPQTPFDTPEIQPTSPQQAAPIPKVPKNPTFFQRVAAIPKLDWGTRAFIYVYCLEPICNLKGAGETKYLVKLQQPIQDEDWLMIDYGSGKYRLQLVHRKPAADKADSIDTYECEIFNPKFPPKIPRNVWMNDPRNEKWASLLPKEEPVVPPTGLGTVTDAFATFTKIRQDMREEFTPPAAVPQDDVAKFKGMVDVVRTIMPQPAPATDNKMLDTVMALMMKQIDASQQETRELRAELRTAMGQKQANGDSSFEAMLDKFEKIAPKLQGLLGLGGEKLTDVVHGRRRPWYEELAVNALPQLAPGFNTLIGAAASYFMGGNKPGLGGGAAAPQTQLAAANGQPAAAAADPLEALRKKVGAFLGANILPMQKRFEAFVKGELRDPSDPSQGKADGTDFAYWIFESFGNDILQSARQLGSANITAMFRDSPYWVAIQPQEKKFAEFLDQVLAFTPDEGNENNEEEAPVDLTEEEEPQPHA